MNSIISRKTALVTGAGGFIGSQIVRKLLKNNYQVEILTKSSSSLWRLDDLKKSIKKHNVSLSDKILLTKLLHKINPNVIIHLAASGSSPLQTDIDKMISTNILGLFNLLFSSRDISYDLFINTGSSSEYGDTKGEISEKRKLNPLSFYAATKSASALICEAFAKETNKNIITIRPFSVYGPYEQNRRFIPTIINSLLYNLPIQLTKEIIRRDFIFIDDLVDAYMRAIKYSPKLTSRIYNIGTGHEYTNEQVVNTLFKVTGKKVKVSRGAYSKRNWDTPHNVANIKLAKTDLHWLPAYSLDKGLLKTYKWFKLNKSLYGQ